VTAEQNSRIRVNFVIGIFRIQKKLQKSTIY
jgi:hypothetical protein